MPYCYLRFPSLSGIGGVGGHPRLPSDVSAEGGGLKVEKRHGIVSCRSFMRF